jgi:hypothetical protein
MECVAARGALAQVSESARCRVDRPAMRQDAPLELEYMARLLHSIKMAAQGVLDFAHKA